jgi:predicted transcriptional regulator
MKIVASLPDPLCAKAERLAKALGVSRSRLCAEAIAESLERRGGSAVTDRLNDVYAEQGSALPAEVACAPSSSLTGEAW